VRELTFDDVKFEMEKNDDFKRSMITPEIESLNNQKIRISGFILPASVFRQQGIKQFVLVRDNQECCFGPGAALFDSIVIDMEPGKTTDFQIRPISVEGKFSIHEWVGPDGKYLSIYHLQASQAK